MAKSGIVALYMIGERKNTQQPLPAPTTSTVDTCPGLVELYCGHKLSIKQLFCHAYTYSYTKSFCVEFDFASPTGQLKIGQSGEELL